MLSSLVVVDYGFDSMNIMCDRNNICCSLIVGLLTFCLIHSVIKRYSLSILAYAIKLVLECNYCNAN